VNPAICTRLGENGADSLNQPQICVRDLQVRFERNSQHSAVLPFASDREPSFAINNVGRYAKSVLSRLASRKFIVDRR
jgi:hypothetical protein